MEMRDIFKIDNPMTLEPTKGAMGMSFIKIESVSQIWPLLDHIFKTRVASFLIASLFGLSSIFLMILFLALSNLSLFSWR